MDKVINGADYSWQMSHQKIDERMLNRFGSDYSLYMAIKNTLSKLPVHDSFILVPPTPYIKAMNAPGWPSNIEPESFYYYTGFKSVDENSPVVDKAIFAIVLDNHRISLRKITNKATLNEIIAEYKKFK